MDGKEEKTVIDFFKAGGMQPKEFKLLYRASEHNFKAAAFHQKCDNIPNTVTLVKTQFGKVFGGFTPLTW